MRISIFTIIFLILFNHNVLASGSKIKIVTSITPLASIIAMLLNDNAEIVAIANNNNCPHHYNLKPSDLQKVKDADLVLYIDDDFDSFASKLMNNHSKNVIKISDLAKIKFISNNRHIWLDLERVKIMLEQLSTILARQFPNLDSEIYQNLATSEKQIDNLIETKEKLLAPLKDVILLSDSLEYLFDEQKYKVQKLYSGNQKSLKYIQNLEKLLDRSASKCLVLGTEEDFKIYKNFKANIVKVESENWAVDQITSSLFFDQYLKIINQIAKCNRVLNDI
jgi:zinc transport system substrate-binding protein